MSPILTPRLLIRPMLPADAPSVHAYHSHPDICRYQSWAQHSIAELSRRITAFAATPPGTPDTWYQLAIELRESSTVIGDIGLHTLADPRLMEIGITLAPEHQHHGHATQALQALLNHLFTQLKTHRVHASVDPRNTPMITLLHRLRFRQESHHLQSVWSDIEQSWTDDLVFALLSSEWPTQPRSA